MEPSEKEARYKALKKRNARWSKVVTAALCIVVFYVGFAVSVFRTDRLYLAIGVPIVLCITAILLSLCRRSYKEEQAVKSEIYDTSEIETTNPLFREILDEYADYQWESLAHLLPKKWKVVDIDAYNGSVFLELGTRKAQTVEVRICEATISVKRKTTPPDESAALEKNLTSENFPDLSAVLTFLADACEKVTENGCAYPNDQK